MTSPRVSSISILLRLEPIRRASRTTVVWLGSCVELEPFEVDLFFKYKSGSEAKDYSHLAQMQNILEVDTQTQWIIDSLYSVQDTVE